MYITDGRLLHGTGINRTETPRIVMLNGVQKKLDETTRKLDGISKNLVYWNERLQSYCNAWDIKLRQVGKRQKVMDLVP